MFNNQNYKAMKTNVQITASKKEFKNGQSGRTKGNRKIKSFKTKSISNLILHLVNRCLYSFGIRHEKIR